VVGKATAQDDGACQLSVRVRDGTGAAIDDARVSFARVDAGVVQERLDALTDAEGTHRLIDLPAGAYDVTVDVPGHALSGAPTFTCDTSNGGRRAFFDVEARAVTTSIEGTVTGRRKVPLALATLAVWQDDNTRTGLTGVVRLRTDDQGRFSARLAPGSYQAWVTADDHVGKKVSFTVGPDKTTAKIALAFSPAVRGTVTDELGAPIAGAVVAVGGAFDPRQKNASVTTDAFGRFSLPVQVGQELTITARGNGRVARAFVGVVDEVERFQHVQLMATTGRTVAGVVYRTDGEPLAFGAVHYRVKSLGLEGEAPLDAKGRFALDGMPEDADVEVWAAGNATGAWGAQVATPTQSQLALLFVPPAW